MFDWLEEWWDEDPARGGFVAMVVCLAILLGCWVFYSANEAAAYERITGKKVSTWDAMFVELRIQESAK